MTYKSTICVGKTSGMPLTTYSSEYEAIDAKNHVNYTYGDSQTHYKCGRCGDWHLAPKDRHTPCTECYFCKGRDGRAKYKYETRADAERRAEILLKEGGKALQVYPCPYSDGWHLTKG